MIWVNLRILSVLSQIYMYIANGDLLRNSLLSCNYHWRFDSQPSLLIPTKEKAKVSRSNEIAA